MSSKNHEVHYGKWSLTRSPLFSSRFIIPIPCQRKLDFDRYKCILFLPVSQSWLETMGKPVTCIEVVKNSQNQSINALPLRCFPGGQLLLSTPKENFGGDPRRASLGSYGTVPIILVCPVLVRLIEPQLKLPTQ